MKITIKNADRVNKNLIKYEKSLIPNINKALEQSAFFLEGEIKEAIAGRRGPLPRRHDTGHLMSSVKGKLQKSMVATVGTNVNYAVYVEYGTTKMKPGQHFRVSLDRNAKKIEKYVQNAIKT